MTQAQETNYGQTAYEAFYAANGVESFPPWDGLPEDQQSHWNSAASAVLNLYEEDDEYAEDALQ